MSQIGSCHVDTILEYLRRVRVDLLALAPALSLSTLPYLPPCLSFSLLYQHWDLVRGGDMIPYNVGECRKHVIQQLRNAAIFAVRALRPRPASILVRACVCLCVLSYGSLVESVRAAGRRE